jgi:hypothetical protein
LEGWETLARRLIAHREQASSREPGEVKSKKLRRGEAVKEGGEGRVHSA